MKELVPQAKLEHTRAQAISVSGLVLSQLDGLQVVTATDYAFADALLTRIRTAKIAVGDKLNPIIRPIYEGLEALYALKRELEKPLDDGERLVKAKMKEYKLEEARQIRAADEERQRAAEKLREQAEEKERKEALAKTAQMRDRLAAQRIALERKAEEVEEAEVDGPVKAAGSRTRTVTTWRLTDKMTFLLGAIEGTIPLDAVSIVQPVITKALRDNPKLVASWPGIEIVEDVQIVGR